MLNQVKRKKSVLTHGIGKRRKAYERVNDKKGLQFGTSSQAF